MMTSNHTLRHINAQQIELSHETIEPTQRVTEKPIVTTGHLEIGELRGCSVGIWEMSSGNMTDVEEDEYFVVLSGRGTVQVLAENGFTEQTQRLTVGSVVRLVAGMHTVWKVEEPLRKIYITPSDETPSRT